MDTSWIDDEDIEESILEKEPMNEILCNYVYIGIDQNISNVTKKVQNLEIYQKIEDYRIIPRDKLLQMIHSNKTFQSKKHRLMEILLYNVDSPSSESLLAVGDELSFSPLHISNAHGQRASVPCSLQQLTSKATKSPEKFGQRAEGLQQLTQKVASLPDEFGNVSPLPNSSCDRRSPSELVEQRLHVPCAPLPLVSPPLGGDLNVESQEPSALRTVTTMDEILIPPSLCIFHETNCLYFIFQEVYQDRDNQMTKPILKIMSDVLPRTQGKKTKKVAFKEDIRHTKKRIN